MESKYYIPDISEFYVGFECEVYNKYSEEWYIFLFNQVFEDTSVAYNFTEGKYRVKYLDKSDIESLGFKQITDDCFNLPLNDDEELRLLYEDNIIVIFLADQYNRSLFRGLIKNKSELKKVLKQLNIVDEEEKKS
jgi:hypothetical protein